MGNDVVMAPNTNFYLDYYQTTDPAANGEPLAIGGSLPMEKCYAFEPFDKLDECTKRHILGLRPTCGPSTSTLSTKPSTCFFLVLRL